jgi:RNA polymerase sigma-B factor
MTELAIRPGTLTATTARRPRRYSPGDAREDEALFALSAAGDRRARDQLIERWLPLARSVAWRYERSHEPFDDLFQVACLALVKAIDRYDPAKGNAFSSYAVPSMVGELKRHFRDRSWAVRPPRALQELTLNVEHAVSRLAAQLDRAPTVAELAADIGTTDEQILEALQARRGRDASSLQAPAPNGDQTTLQDTLGVDDGEYVQAEMRVLLDSLMTGLPRRTREILRLRFAEDLTQAEIGEIFGVSQMQISRIIREAIGRLREIAEHHEGWQDN